VRWGQLAWLVQLALSSSEKEGKGTHQLIVAQEGRVPALLGVLLAQRIVRHLARAGRARAEDGELWCGCAGGGGPGQDDAVLDERVVDAGPRDQGDGDEGDDEVDDPHSAQLARERRHAGLVW